MPLDPNIILQGRGPQIDNPLDVQQKAQSLSNLGQQNKMQKQELDMGQIKMAKQLAWSISDEPSYQAARQRGIELGLPNADKLPPMYDPEFVKGMQYNTLTAEERFARADKDRDFGLREQELQSRAEDRRDSREERRTLAGLARMDRLDARADKKKELSSAQAKQRGLYESGALAESQYNKATADKSNYDPTGVGQIIDNSEWAPNWLKNNKAVEAQAAQAAWVESYLRDASGAAIPPSERMAYAKDFFPQPGDTPDVVQNKAMLRAQKAENARVAAGVETGHGPALAGPGPNIPSKKVPHGTKKVKDGITYVKVDGGWLPETQQANK